MLGQLKISAIALLLIILSATIIQAQEVSSEKNRAITKTSARFKKTSAPNPIEQASDDYQQAQETEATQNNSAEEQELPSEIDTSFRYAPRSGTSGINGSVGLTESASNYLYKYKIFDQIPLELSAGAQYIGIDNSSNFSLPTRLTETSFDAEITLPFFFDKTYTRLGIIPSFFSDNWSFNSINFKMLGQAFIIYQPCDKFTAILGIAAFPGYYTKIAPLAGIIYKPNDKWSFNLIQPRPNIDYAINKKVSVFTEYSVISNEYKVDKDNMSNVTLQYQEQRAGFGLNYKLNKQATGIFSIGETFKRGFQYRDSLGKLKLKSGLYGELRFNMNM